jgi:hypothetical protein
VQCRAMWLFGVFVVSCYDPNLPDGQVWTSQHFRYAARADDSKVCGTVVDQLEAHLQAIDDYLGLTWTHGSIGYYKFLDSADFRSNSECPSSAIACATPRQDLRTTRILDGHELVHVYMRPIGEPSPFFEEGLAEALSPEGRTFVAPDKSWRDIVAVPRGQDEPLNYTAGGWFVSYLLQTFGPARFVAFYRAVLDPAPAAVAAQFSSIYGLDLDAVWDQARASKPKLSGVPVWECASARPMVQGDTLSEGCDGTGAFAGIDLAQPTALRSHAKKLDYIIATCSEQGGLYSELPYCGDTEGLVSLPTGKYYLVTGRYMYPPRIIPFTEIPDLLGTDCASLSAVDMRSWQDTVWLKSFVFSIANSAEAVYVKLQFDEGDVLDLKRELDHSTSAETMAGATVEVCDSCQGPCHVVDYGAPLRVSNGTVLRLTNVTGPMGSTVAILGTW